MCLLLSPSLGEIYVQGSRNWKDRWWSVWYQICGETTRVRELAKAEVPSPGKE